MKQRIKCSLFAVGFTLSAALAPAATTLRSFDEFQSIAVMENGRKMPMDTFARHKLLQLSGKSTVGGRPAIDWLARMIFDPAAAKDDPVFLVNNPEVLEALGIRAVGRRCPFAQLEPALPKLDEWGMKATRLDAASRSAADNEILRLCDAVALYAQLVGTLDFLEPLDDFKLPTAEVREQLGFPSNQENGSYADLVGRIDKIRPVVEKLAAKDQTQWTPLEQEIFRLSSAMFAFDQEYAHGPLTIFPIKAHGEEIWLAPQEAFALHVPSASLKAMVTNLVDMAAAYESGSQAAFDQAARTLRQSVADRLEGDPELRHLSLEVRYNQLDLLYRAETLYGFAFLLVFAFQFAARRGLRWSAAALVVAGFVLHTVAITARVVIMGRPPVTNLYSTFVFVAWVFVLLGLVLELLQKNSLGLLAAALGGLVLLLVSGRFAADGDPMGKVVAVLDSNFWLTTHVITITMGYAGCAFAGLMGHVFLIQSAKRARAELLDATYRSLTGLLGFGLTFSFLGTMLGGVWADQSWGRFWGWDPKENGALLIVLWCSILFHARAGGLIGRFGMAMGSIFGVIVVAMAWLGVNLLGVGLHSYGFTSGLAWGLFAFTAAEVLFMVAGWFVNRRVKARSLSPTAVS